MPNYCRNIIKVTSGDFRTVADFMKSEERGFDFSNLIHLPDVFRQFNGVCKLDELGADFWKAMYNGSDDDLELATTAILTSRYERSMACECIQRGYKRFLAWLETGYIDSLYWAQDKWGTKWNATDIVIQPERQTFVFNTAWSEPTPIFEALCRQFPTHTFDIKYADFEGGWFSGEGIGQGGEYRDTCYKHGKGERGAEIMEYVENYKLQDNE